MRAELLAADAPEWSGFLAYAAHDFYHLPSYVVHSARTTEPGEPAAAWIADSGAELLLPLILRPIPGGGEALDATSPYGYPGPLVRGDPTADFIARALDLLEQLLVKRGVVALFTRLHPLLELEGLGQLRTLIYHGETVVVDLGLTAEEQWSQVQSGHRNEINRARRAGHSVRFDDHFEHLESFIRLYQQTMTRVEASGYYDFQRDYFLGLCEALGDRLKLCLVEISGAVAAAGLFVESSGIVQYHLSGMDEAFVRERPTKLMIDHVRLWAGSRGNRWLHLGGGLGAAQDSLFRFKAGFSKLRRSSRSWRVILDQDKYRALATARQPGPDWADLAGYFPAYRRR